MGCRWDALKKNSLRIYTVKFLQTKRHRQRDKEEKSAN